MGKGEALNSKRLISLPCSTLYISVIFGKLDNSLSHNFPIYKLKIVEPIFLGLSWGLKELSRFGTLAQCLTCDNSRNIVLVIAIGQTEGGKVIVIGTGHPHSRRSMNILDEDTFELNTR